MTLTARMLVFVAGALFCFGLPAHHLYAVDGGPTGWWSDNEGNNYYGDSSSSGSSGSDWSGSSSSATPSSYDPGPTPAEEAFDKGLAASRAGDNETAIHYYEESLRLDPNNYAGWNNLGNRYNAKGWLNKAVECFERSLQVKPNYKEAKKNLKELKSWLVDHPEVLARSEELKSADLHGQYAVAAGSSETAKEESGRVFDTPGEFAGSLETLGLDGSVVDARNVSLQEEEIPEAFMNRPEIAALVQQRQGHRQRRAALEAQVEQLIEEARLESADHSGEIVTLRQEASDEKAKEDSLTFAITEKYIKETFTKQESPENVGAR